jgi:hypothetical protein
MSLSKSKPTGQDTPDYSLSRGRPSKPQQLSIESALREFFTQASSATFASQKTGYDIKTVTKYYNQFMQEIKDTEPIDIQTRFDDERKKFLYAYDELCYSLYQDKMEIQDMIAQSKESNDLKTFENLFRIKQKINSDLINLVLARFNLSFCSITSFWKKI